LLSISSLELSRTEVSVMTGLSTELSRAAGANDQSSLPQTKAVPISFKANRREIVSIVPDTAALDTTAGNDANGIRFTM